MTTGRDLAAAAAVVAVGSAVGALTRVGYPPGVPRPRLAPPPWVFGVVWPALYATIGVAAARATGTDRALVLGNLAANLTWPFAFARSARLGLAVIVVLAAWTWYLVLARGTWILAPYAAWLTFATWLNAEIVRSS